jgi:hypothetical protein
VIDVINESADVLRHGWYDAAATLAADIPEVAELLQARLEIAITSHSLDERHLLDTIEEVEAMSSRAGSPASEALALRLRRTVYEYLLALDAVVPGRAPADAGAATSAETTAALAESAGVADATPPAGLAAGAADVADGDAGLEDALTAPRPVALRRRGRAEDDQTSPEDGTEPVPGVEAVVETVESSPAGDEPGSTIVAPKAGFHILDEEAASPAPGEGQVTPMAMPAFASDEVAAIAPAENEPQAGTGAGDEFLAWDHAHRERPASAPLPGTVADASPPPLTVAHPAAAVDTAAAASFTAAPAEAHGDDTGADAEEDDDDPQRGWRVRRNGEPRRGRGAGLAQAQADVDEDPFDGNTKLTETRRKIEDRLRHKRCDEAAALLQEIALEPGGRAIADLAMNAGDRCRALGKSNAALNCYLAASRSDPVYELPLSRLADVCIDDKDTDLAVSYLERVARIYRYRGDDKGALRVYRRIATIAPYREDVLALLMAAQSTGRIDT